MSVISNNSKIEFLKIIKIIMLIVLLSLLFGCSKKALVIKKENMIVEYGTPISTEVATYINDKEIDKNDLNKVLDETKLEIIGDKKVDGKDFQQKGDYTVKLTYEKEEAEVKVSVKDTTKPQFVKDTKKEVSFTKDCKPTAEDFSKMFKAEDLDTVKITVDDSKVDYAKEGTYQAIVKAVDASQNESTQTVTVKITKPELKLDVSKKSMYVKESFVLKPTVKGKDKKATFKSSNTNIATVSETGKVTAKKKGTAIITVEANGVKAECKVTVKSVPKGSSTTTQTIKNPTTGKNETVTVVKPKPQESSSASLAYSVLNDINAYRRQAGLPDLVWRHELDSIVKTRAKEFSITLDHVRPDGTDYVTIFTKEQAIKWLPGEILTNAPNPAKAWYNSAGHRKIMLNPKNIGIAIGVYKGHYAAILIKG